MDNDYLLIAVDAEKKFAIRFLSLRYAMQESVALHTPGDGIRQMYAEFLLASSILGSRLDEQESMLFKLKFPEADLSINCEVSPRGVMRSAIFPEAARDPENFRREGLFKTVRLNRGNEVYESVIDIANESIEELIRKYLQASVQTNSVFFLNADTENFENNYALWIEKLPGTTDADWNAFRAQYASGDVFRDSIAGTEDPDVIIGRLFPEPITILAVTQPRLTCTCSKEKIVNALTLLTPHDLADIFMQGQGVSTRCEYCGKVWQVSDEDVKNLMKVSGTLQ